jgi:hypothetical protein
MRHCLQHLCHHHGPSGAILIEKVHHALFLHQGCLS